MRKSRVTAKQRRLVAKRAQGCCEYCLSQARFATQSFSVEQIIPFPLIIGLTPTGRAMVETLRLNREGLVNLRRLLYAAQKHPPR